MADELTYDKDGFLIYTGLSPLHEDEDIAEDVSTLTIKTSSPKD